MSATLNITADDLKEMIAVAVSAAIVESRKPDPPTAQELAATQWRRSIVYRRRKA